MSDNKNKKKKVKFNKTADFGKKIPLPTTKPPLSP